MRYVTHESGDFAVLMLKFCSGSDLKLSPHDMRQGQAVTATLQVHMEGIPHDELALKYLGGLSVDASTAGKDYMSPGF
jgi:hypothetical protein